MQSNNFIFSPPTTKNKLIININQQKATKPFFKYQLSSLFLIKQSNQDPEYNNNSKQTHVQEDLCSFQKRKTIVSITFF